MKNILKLFVITFIFSCTNKTPNTFKIHGETDRVGDAILLKIDPLGNYMDTANIKNGKFIFKKEIEEEELFKLKFFDGSSFDILMKPGEDVEINYKNDELSISGSSGSEKLMELEYNLENLLEFRDSITKSLQQLGKSPDFEEEMIHSREKFFQKLNLHKEYLKNFIENNKDSKISLIALFQTYGKSSPVLTVDEELETFESVLKNLKLHFPKSNHILLLEEQIEKLKPLAYGQPAPNFTLPDINNNSISLSDFRNKIVLIDFWASWCKPCRIENPKLVKLYNQYSNQNFEIISISLDGTSRQKDPKNAWIKAIQDDNLSKWIHLSELNGWKTYVRELYNFNSIPYTILVDGSGKIVGKNLKGLELERKIKQLIEDGKN